MNKLVVGMVPCSPAFTENRMFDIESARDNALERFVETQSLLEDQGMICQTSDTLHANQIDVLLFYNLALEFEDILSVVKANPCVYLLNIPIEPSMVAPLHFDCVLQHMPFDRVLTWNDRLVTKGLPFVKANIGEPVIHLESIPRVKYADKYFMGCVYSNKSSKDENSLYGDRIRAIEFFSGQEEKMDLYGIGWESSSLQAVRKSYKGKCVRKRDVLKQYKFSLCFENTRDDAGLITEKIFDCFAAGTVPIYYGAPNIQDYIPSECYIDFREFINYERLYDFMVKMTEEEYQVYLDAVKAFIDSSDYQRFTSKGFSQTVLSQIQSLKSVPVPNRGFWTFKRDVIRAAMHYRPRSMKNFLRHIRFVLKFTFAR
ncbi:glycosyltransferase family 10 domain-containing protein [Mariprofundus sp. EBB-1]|uniref:glycosyltransferase family 10 domain-containing protein n=1 Tax=Mariprofundus sp. EBB-1 TaxID=2650971 RepID=UPI00137A29D5|nr:glycosyltransferase family 10 [Mariprofundus sp. EBB-1]